MDILNSPISLKAPLPPYSCCPISPPCRHTWGLSPLLCSPSAPAADTRRHEALISLLPRTLCHSWCLEPSPHSPPGSLGVTLSHPRAHFPGPVSDGHASGNLISTHLLCLNGGTCWDPGFNRHQRWRTEGALRASSGVPQAPSPRQDHTGNHLFPPGQGLLQQAP